MELEHLWGHGQALDKTNISISQSFDWPGAYKARSIANRANSSAALYLAESNRRELLSQIKLTLIDAVSAKERMELQKKALHRIDSLLNIVERGVERKEVSILNANKLKIEHLNLTSVYDKAVAEYNQALLSLTEFNNGVSCDDILSELPSSLPGGTLRPLEAYIDEYRTMNPAVTYRQKLIDAKRLEAKAIKKSYMPSFSLGAAHAKEDGERFTGLTAGMTLPFFSGRGKKKVNELETEALTLEMQQADLTDESSVKKDYDAARQFINQISQYEKVLAETDYIGLASKAFAARYITILDYINELSYYNGAVNSLIDLRKELQITLTRLERYASAAR